MQFLDDAIEVWSLDYDDFDFIESHQHPARLDLAVKLLSYRGFGRFFPFSEIDDKIIHRVGDQLLLKPSEAVAPTYSIRTDRRRRQAVTDYLNISDITGVNLESLQTYLSAEPSFAAMSYDELESVMLKWCVNTGVSAPPSKWMQRAHETLRNKVDAAIFADLAKQIDEKARQTLLESITGEGHSPSLLQMRQATGSTSRDTFNVMAQRVAFTNDLNLTNLKVNKLQREWRDEIVRRVEKLDPWEIKRMDETSQIGMYATFLGSRSPDFTDALVETLINAVAKIQRSAEAKVAKAVGKQAKQVYDKEALLREILSAALHNPERAIGNVVFDIPITGLCYKLCYPQSNLHQTTSITNPC